MKNEIEICRLKNNINIIKKQLDQRDGRVLELKKELGNNKNAPHLNEDGRR